MIRTYSGLIQLPTFIERFRYLALRGTVGEATFGYDRWMNQGFYKSREWRHIRHKVIVRDNGCDLGMEDHEMFDQIYIHHMVPLTPEQIEEGHDLMLDLDNLISTSLTTHNAIHYGDEKMLPRPYVERRPGDTQLW